MKRPEPPKPKVPKKPKGPSLFSQFVEKIKNLKPKKTASKADSQKSVTPKKMSKTKKTTPTLAKMPSKISFSFSSLKPQHFLIGLLCLSLFANGFLGVQLMLEPKNPPSTVVQTPEPVTPVQPVVVEEESVSEETELIVEETEATEVSESEDNTDEEMVVEGEEDFMASAPKTNAMGIVEGYFDAFDKDDFDTACTLLSLEKCNPESPASVNELKYRKPSKGFLDLKIWESNSDDDFHSEVVCVDFTFNQQFRGVSHESTVTQRNSYYVKNGVITAQVCEGRLVDGYEYTCAVQAARHFCD